ncbi:DUF1285 domain-containing protein [Granulosicoccus antarcticus]|uniref:Proteophosphoglycan n=1 Tax=Granulosicoccus antarcticus IMCC3135 TaxID=1192854 RepID=A0A2Z2NTS1_9GAMM|nr:DUF1285 domain-containing protein [Granulosicoccus antarcticus]ASJ74952.1 hypothetical protein IMCC3135_24425 [Granulosicoccus antarcticus IMCC3135]
MSDQASLESIADVVSQRSLPPVASWHPELTRDIDIRIARNGDWFHEGTKIDRARMVKLFSTILRVDDDATCLVTPQERLRIVVEDAPFTAILMEVQGEADEQVLTFETNVGDRVIADAEHPVTVSYATPGGEPSPYVLVRDRLTALISRTVFYQLAELAEERNGVLGVVSKGCFMPLSDQAAVDSGAV